MGCLGCLGLITKIKTPINSRESSNHDRTVTANERNAFNVTNRNLSVDLIRPNVNEAALLFIKEYGGPPASKENETSARHLFVNLVSSKVANLASLEFKKVIDSMKTEI